jgi:hypothetical protein
MKLSRKDKKTLIEARLRLSMIQFHMELPWIVKKLFSKQALDWYQRGKDDAYGDLQYCERKIKQIEAKS